MTGLNWLVTFEHNLEDVQIPYFGGTNWKTLIIIFDLVPSTKKTIEPCGTCFWLALSVM